MPYGAGHSDGSDGEAIYVDHHIPERLSVEKSDGSGHAELNPLDYLRRHEGFEETLMRHGMGYARAHELATAFEHEALRAAGFDPVSYERALAPYVDQAMHQHGRDIPADLDRQPYREEGQDGLLNRIGQSAITGNALAGEGNGKASAAQATVNRGHFSSITSRCSRTVRHSMLTCRYPRPLTQPARLAFF